MKLRFRGLIAALVITTGVAYASTGAEEPKQIEWSFDGVFGKFDKPSVQRGLQVYKEVCSACHSLKRVPFRSLSEIGLSDAEVKSFAAGYTVKDGPNDSGEMYDRPGLPSDHFPGPYANEKAARASNNGAYPPDQSLLVKAREDGANYIYSLLTGYTDAPAYRCAEVTDGKCTKFDPLSAEDAKAAASAAADAAKTKPDAKAKPDTKTAAAAKPGDKAKPDDKAAAPASGPAPATVGQLFYCSDLTDKEDKDADGKTVKTQDCRELGKTMHYNPYFPGKQIAMNPPLRDDSVTYQDGTKATVYQEAHDVVNFLQWAAEPEMEQRKRMGIHVILFLSAMTCFFYVVKKRIWSDLH